jgi:hypothetical protein
MATRYPNGIDNTSSLPYVTNGVSPMVGDDVNRLRDAVVAVETELGANPSGTFTSVDARIEAAETAISDYANSTFLVLSTDGFISQERVFSPSVNFAAVDGGAGANYEIDLASSVGIGTITPASDYSLTLDGDGATRIGGITLRSAGTDTFRIGSASALDAANISLMNPNAGYVSFGTNGAERVKITSAGDVGIGTLAPSERLHVSGGNLLLESTAGAGLPYATIKGTQGGVQLSSSNSIGKLDILDSTGSVAISLLNSGDNRLVGANNADFSFYTNNAEKMRLTAPGELLINTTANPDSARLHLSGGGITHSSDRFNARPGSGINYEWINRNGAGHTWYVNSAATQAMTIAGTGNVGIGTASPAALFSIGASSQFRVDSSGDISRIRDVSYSFPATQGIAGSVLRNNGSGSLNWSLVSDTEIIGGLQTVADIAARDAIPDTQRKEGMIVYSQADDRHFVLEGGVSNGDWKELGDDNRLVGGLQTVADAAARDAIPAAKRKEGMIVYSQADDRHFVLEGGVSNGDWKELGDDNRLVGGLQTVADAAARDAIPAAKRKEGMIVYSQADDRHFVLEGGVSNGDWKELGDDSRLVGGYKVVTTQAQMNAIGAPYNKEGSLVFVTDNSTLFQRRTIPPAAAAWVIVATFDFVDWGIAIEQPVSVSETLQVGVGLENIGDLGPQYSNAVGKAAPTIGDVTSAGTVYADSRLATAGIIVAGKVPDSSEFNALLGKMSPQPGDIVTGWDGQGDMFAQNIGAWGNFIVGEGSFLAARPEGFFDVISFGADPDEEFFKFDMLYETGSGNVARLRKPLMLPHMSRLDSLSTTFRPRAASWEASSVNVYRVAKGDHTATRQSILSATGGGGAVPPSANVTLSATTTTNNLIDNSNYSYYMEIVVTFVIPADPGEYAMIPLGTTVNIRRRDLFNASATSN